jgi:2,3-diketo-5-methylthio-1-phosphopentane phosphatase
VSRIAVLCDFDGTIARDDVGSLFFRTFGGEQSREIVEEWKTGLISSRECLEREAAIVDASPQEIRRFVGQRKLDPFFKDFADFAGRNDIEVVVVSDGLDYYIENMLMRNGLGVLESYSNVMREVEGKIHVEFPHFNKLDCRDCGNCKTYHLENYRKAGYYVVYVGNGLSDRCPSTYSDLVFAKGELLDFCRANDLQHVAFSNFRDVEREMISRFVLNGDIEDREFGS